MSRKNNKIDKIIFNTSILGDKPTGVGIYTTNLYNSIQKLKPGYKYASRKMEGVPKKLISVARLFWNAFYLPLIIKKNELVFSFSTHGSPFSRRQIITVHDLISLNFPQQHRFQYYYFKFLVPIILHRCIKIVAISEFTKAELIKFYGIQPEKIVVIRNGATYKESQDANIYQTELKSITNNRPYFLSVGASYTHKNTLRLVEAIALAKCDFLCIIVGSDNEYMKSVKEKVSQLGLDNIIFLNYVSDGLLGMLYKHASCNLYLSLYEGFGFPPLEAAYYNTVSLVADIPIMHEIYDNAVWYADPLSIEDIADKLKKIASDNLNVNTLRKQFPLLINTYTWENTAQHTSALINKFL